MIRWLNIHILKLNVIRIYRFYTMTKSFFVCIQKKKKKGSKYKSIRMCEDCNKLHPKPTTRRRVRVYTVLESRLGGNGRRSK